MEIIYSHIFTIIFYLFLLFFIFYRKRKVDFLFILAVLLTIFWYVQSIINNLHSDHYYFNFYSQLLSLFGWAIWLQSIYLKIPGTRRAKLVYIYGVNILLVFIFSFQYKIDSSTQLLYFNKGTTYFAGLMLAIAMMFYLENIIRCLKSEYRYAYKHMIFSLAFLAGMNLIYFYQLLINKEINLLLSYLLLFAHIPLPLFLLVSFARVKEVASKHFNANDSRQLQYFLILTGIVLIVAGILQVFDLYFSQARRDLYQALFFIFLFSITGGLSLSSDFRNEFGLYLRSYFYGDPNDYKKEWDAVSQITRNEEGIYRRMSDYFQQCLKAESSALYVYQYGGMKLETSNFEKFPSSLSDLDDFINDTNQIAIDIYGRSNHLKQGNHDLFILLNVEEDLVGLCWLKVTYDPFDLNSASTQLFHKVSTEFALRLWEIRHKSEKKRKDKLLAFNKTVAFLAHDLKNIVAQQQLAYENFNKYKDDPEFLEDFHETIGHSTKRLGNLIAQLRDKSLKVNKKPVTFADLVKFIRQKERLTEGRLQFLLHNDERLNPLVDANVLLVVENLLNNALEASGLTEKVVISVELNQDLKVKVIDNGKGMTKSFIQNELFKPFSSNNSEHGLGVGMYHVKTILEEMNADIKVDSQPDRGTTIQVVMPI